MINVAQKNGIFLSVHKFTIVCLQHGYSTQEETLLLLLLNKAKQYFYQLTWVVWYVRGLHAMEFK